MLTLRQIAEAHGDVRSIAKETELNSNHLYRTVLPQGCPELPSFFTLLNAIGLRFAIQPDPQHAAL